MSTINPNKQKLDELLGIVAEMQKADPVEFGGMVGVIKAAAIPNDIPEQVEVENSTLTQEEVDAQRPSTKASTKQNTASASPTPVQSTAAQQVPQQHQNFQPSPLERMDETEMVQTQKSLTEIDSLIEVAKQVITHVYTVVTSSDLLDAPTLTAAANLIKETRNLVQEHLEIQKSQRDFLNQIQMEQIKHQHQLELMEKKYELERLKFQAKNPPMANQNVPSQPPQGGTGAGGLKSYSSADMMRMLDEETP